MNPLFEEFKQSVYELANKLPQWSSEDYSRRFHSAMSSLFEEAGEISGLVSKRRIRKNYWKAVPSTLEDFNVIKQEFISEASDFLWVLTCSCYVLGHVDIDLIKQFSEAEVEYNNYELDFEQTLYDVFSLLVLTENANLFEDRCIHSCLEDVAYSFGLFLASLAKEYSISFDELLTYNMDKLGHRYDKDGKRVDGK